MTNCSSPNEPKPEPNRAPRLLDARTWNGPWCLLKVASFFARLQPGELMEVLVSDPAAARDLPRLLRASGGIMVSEEIENGHERLIVERRPVQAQCGCCGRAATTSPKQGEKHVPGN